MGLSINDVSSKGKEGGGGQKCRNLLSKKTTKGREGSHKIGKMGKRSLWKAPYCNLFHRLRRHNRIFHHKYLQDLHIFRHHTETDQVDILKKKCMVWTVNGVLENLNTFWENLY